MTVKGLCRKHGFSDAAFYGWGWKVGGLQVSEAKRLKELEAENADLRVEISRLHDPAELEELARACLGMVGPGEVAFVLPSLVAGGAARVALNLAGALDRARFAPVLIVLAHEGTLADAVPHGVPVEALGRARLRQTALVIDGQKCVEPGIEPSQAIQIRLRQFDAGQFLLRQQGGQLFESGIEHFWAGRAARAAPTARVRTSTWR